MQEEKAAVCNCRFVSLAQHVALKQVLKGKTIKATDNREVEYWFTKAGCAELT